MAQTKLAFTAEDEERLARGWPNLIVPIDGHVSDKTSKSAAKAALKSLNAIDPFHFTEWPRSTLHRFLRAAGATLFLNDATKRVETGAKQDRAVAIDALLTPAEAIDVIRGIVRAGDEHYSFLVHDVVYGVESIAGTDATLATIADNFETFDPSAPETATFNHLTKTAVAETIGFLLLRASPSVASREKKRLENAYVRMSKIVDSKKVDDYAWFIIMLDLSLHGARAVKAVHAKSPHYATEHANFEWLEYAGDDPAYVLEKWKLEPKDAMSVRIVHIAGATALEGLEKRKWPAVQMPSVVRDFGMLKNENVVALMLSLIGKSSVKDAPLAWFRAHADYAKPLLEKSKNAAAKTILSAIK